MIGSMYLKILNSFLFYGMSKASYLLKIDYNTVVTESERYGF